MAEEIACRDWSENPLGDLEHWPDTLKDTLNLILKSRFSTVILWGKDFLTFYNDAFAPVLEGKAAPLGRPFREVIPEQWSKIGPLLQNAWAGEAVYCDNFEVSVERNWEVRESWWTFSFSPITDKQGNILGVFAPVHDVTARFLAKAQLIENKKALQIVSDMVPSMLWRCRPNEKLIWKNRRMEGYFGQLDHDLWVHPDDRPARDAEWDRAVRERSSFTHTHRLINTEGQYRWHIATSEPRYDNKGNIVEWVGSSTDIHDIRMATEALAESRALFVGFARNFAGALWIADLETGEFEYANSAFHNIWSARRSSAPMKWEDWLSTVHPDDSGLRSTTRERLRSGEVVHDEYRIVRSDGSIRWIRETSFPIVAADRTIRKVGGIAEDITQNNRMIVHLIDTDILRRNKQSRALEMAGYQVRAFADIDTFFRFSRALLPGCVIHFDDHDNGAESCRLAGALKDQAQRLPLILVRDLKDPHEAVNLMKLGVSDILPRDALGEKLEHAVATALATMQTSARETIATQTAREKLQALTERELQILDGLCEGGTSKMIARDLGLSPRTVETYRVRILGRLGVATLPEAVKLAAIASI